MVRFDNAVRNFKLFIHSQFQFCKGVSIIVTVNQTKRLECITFITCWFLNLLLQGKNGHLKRVCEGFKLNLYELCIVLVDRSN